MEYNWFVELYWDCLHAQWGHANAKEITEACIHEQSAFEYWANEISGLLARKAYCKVRRANSSHYFLFPSSDSFI